MTNLAAGSVARHPVPMTIETAACAHGQNGGASGGRRRA
jgi:hypothetical protein